MLTSRVAELEKRDRLNAKGKDGGSFIPSAVLITGTTDNTIETVVNLPRYININNILSASLMLKTGTASWVMNDSDFLDDYYVLYNTTENSIHIAELDSGHQQVKFRLTIFYKG
jgi:hypothetical protein